MVGPEKILVEYKFKGKTGRVSGTFGRRGRGVSGAGLGLKVVQVSRDPPCNNSTSLWHFAGKLTSCEFLWVGQHPPPAMRTSPREAGAVWTNEARFSLSVGHYTWLPAQVLALLLCEALGIPFSFLGLSLSICKMAGLSEMIFEDPSYSSIV